MLKADVLKPGVLKADVLKPGVLKADEVSWTIINYFVSTTAVNNLL